MKTLRHIFHSGNGLIFILLLSAGLAWPFLTFDIPGPYVVLISAILYSMLFLLVGHARAGRERALKELYFQAGRSLLHNAEETGQYADKKGSDYAMDHLKQRMERLDRVLARATFVYDPKAKVINYYPNK